MIPKLPESSLKNEKNKRVIMNIVEIVPKNIESRFILSIKKIEKKVMIEVIIANEMYIYGSLLIPVEELERKIEFPIFIPNILPKIKKKYKKYRLKSLYFSISLIFSMVKVYSGVLGSSIYFSAYPISAKTAFLATRSSLSSKASRHSSVNSSNPISPKA